MEKLSKEYEINSCYEASCNGYAFQRKMRSWGYHCDVIAPSLIPRKSGDRRKNDFRDARNLAQQYANGMLTVIRPPTEEEESVRGLVRCRLSFKRMERSVKQQINSLVLSQGYQWHQSKWTVSHRAWLAQLTMPHHYLQEELEEFLSLLEYIATRLRALNTRIEEIACSEIYSSRVNALRAFKGIGTLAAMTLLVEITDFRRFSSPRALMSYLGLIPSEDSSGEKQKHGSITKAGNVRCRTQLVESAQHYIKKPKITLKMKYDLEKADPKSTILAIKCMNRLHKRFWTLIGKGKPHQVAITAIAREFTGFIWAAMQGEHLCDTER
jgi:transposase